MLKYIAIVLITMLASCINYASAENFMSGSDVKSVLDKYELNGTFVLLDDCNKKMLIFNAQRADERMSPGSTFKIFNSLIGLDTGAVSNVDEVFYKYQGEPVFLQSWRQDASLRSAIRLSQVPAYKCLANKIGLKKMQQALNNLGYGNCVIGEKLDAFWLDNSLQISANEQVGLLKQLINLKLPYTAGNQQAVKEICLLESTACYKLYGKTGWATDNVAYPIGWFIGWAETANGIYIFAFNADIDKTENLYKREACVKELLTRMEILKNEV